MTKTQQSTSKKETPAYTQIHIYTYTHTHTHMLTASGCDETQIISSNGNQT